MATATRKYGNVEAVISFSGIRTTNHSTGAYVESWLVRLDCGHGAYAEVAPETLESAIIGKRVRCEDCEA